MLDVVTVGETQVRFSPKGYLRLDQAHEMEVNAAGAESNVAVALDCTIVGDAAFITRAEVEELLASEDQEIQR
ncbi:MAG: hypothetical protein HY803_03685 [candidate division NC10 bacterium]|nr:hypothetical protein [candidate division NC10 bacterium]